MFLYKTIRTTRIVIRKKIVPCVHDQFRAIIYKYKYIVCTIVNNKIYITKSGPNCVLTYSKNVRIYSDNYLINPCIGDNFIII